MTAIILVPTVTQTTTPDCEPSQFILPNLINYCPYPLRQNRHCHTVARSSDQWLIDVTPQLAEPEIRGYEHTDMDTGTLAAVCYPDADEFHLRVCSDFLNWLFIVDDWMEYNVVDVRKTRESCISALRDPINFDAEQLGAKMCKSRFRETAGAGCIERFIHASELFFAAVAKQVDDRSKGEYLELISLTEVISHPVVVALQDATNDHMVWSNDIFSYNMEQSRGDVHWHNMVAVLMHERGLDLQGAIDYAGQMCQDAIQRFEYNRAMLPSWGAEVDRQVDIYVQGLQNIIVGPLHWQSKSARYFGKDGHAVKWDRVVKLLPKGPRRA
ncbi:isoprenoid synthase domain-containing protein [Suillus bovinus]|uniref:isoprenoid synthase domain-containing protein n=1 Tax=Suillus bovinus TaxID=48563 RepID=UPI001B868596|nr:isoprenoid synthase domain-containing protein [Suillus bovinus]KAG2129186.1 isoprenoid synthase domain-containing protein [Suillus bovinus]